MKNPDTLHPYFKRHPNPPTPPKKKPAGVPVFPGCWSISDLAAAYGLPTDMKGVGKIAIGELGGAYYEEDTAQAFTAMGLPAPNVTIVSVDGTQPEPSDADGEVQLDVQMAGAVYAFMTGKSAQIVLYYSSDIGTATQKAAEDGCTVMSWSWGSDESNWGTAALAQMEQISAAATASGMTVTAASGDNSADDGGGIAGVDAPASCPHVLGCGGTNKTKIAETVWGTNNADGGGTGGGFSAAFPKQPWQTGVPTAPGYRGRMVPDVAGNADPRTGIMVVVQGQWEPIGGTSAIAPMYAGIIAACAISPLGWINPLLWSNQNCFDPTIPGENGSLPYQKQPPVPGPCTGLGVPIGAKLAALLNDGPPEKQEPPSV